MILWAAIGRWALELFTFGLVAAYFPRAFRSLCVFDNTLAVLASYLVISYAILRHQLFRVRGVLAEWGLWGAVVGVMLGLVVFLALVINHTLASISGAGIPMLMKKLGFDPAQSATIFATTVTDIAGFFSLLGLAYLFMKYLI